MAVTPNSIIKPQTQSTLADALETGDKTTAALLFAAGANGTRIYKILVGPDDDGTGANREVGIYIYDGSASHRLCLVDVTADDAADIVPVDVLANVPQKVDENGNKCLDIPSGYSVYITGANVTANNAVIVDKWDF